VPPPEPNSPRRAPLFGWLALLYATSGLPYGIATDGVPTVLRYHGVDLAALGLLAWLEAPWVAKFLWGPLVDRIGDRRWWVVGAQLAVAALLLALAAVPSGEAGWPIQAVLLGIALASATLDVALDGYAVEVVPAGLVGPASGVRTTAYRLALIVAGGFLVAREKQLGWAATWRWAAAGFVVLAIVSARAPAAGPRARAKAGTRPWEPIAALARRPGFAAALAFVVLFKIGDYLMARMTKPFLVDHGFPQDEMTWLATVTMASTVAGALLGGLYAARVGLFRALWVLGALQAVSNLGYAVAGGMGMTGLWGAAVLEAFCGGLGTAPFLGFLMRCCDREHAGTQFAFLTALMALGRIGAGLVSGWGASRLGYPLYFSLTFVAALPAFLLLPSVRPLAK
jgi:PAT family beta-lactamase induction signal transducer AmpG